MSRIIILFLLFMSGSLISPAQIPSSCFEIQSILVDACGDPEGENEMVRFIVGSSNLNTTNLNVDWPNNSYLGICQNATTASHVAALNATIQACGLILEPTGGILPAGATVLLVTSTAMNPSFNSFAGLTDTIYMIFQCPGNTAGHFRNYSMSTAIRSLEMEFMGSCSDQVSYDASFLVDQNGIQTVADGSTVEYDFAGNAGYINPGCQAPVSALQVMLSAGNPTICSGDLVSLNAAILSGNYISYFWRGGNGTIIDPGMLNTNYQTHPVLVGIDNIEFCIITNCGDTLIRTLQLNIAAGSAASVTSSGPVSFCTGDSVVLTASPGNSYLWSTGETTRSITVNSTDNYSVTVTGSCGTSTASQSVLAEPLPSAVIMANGPLVFCQGNSVLLSGISSGNYLWSTGETSASINVSSAGTYILSVSNFCGTDTDSAEVVVDIFPDAAITGAPALLCPGESVILSTGPATNYLWNDGSSGRELTVNSGGLYSVLVSNSCGSDTSSVFIGSSVLNTSIIADTMSGGAPLPVSFRNLTFGGISYNWDMGDGTASTDFEVNHIYTEEGSYEVILTATDAQGCTGESRLLIEVFDDTNISIPNAFTPNGDGMNELFNMISNKRNLNISGVIFNRWGHEIAEWNSLYGGWDGSKTGGTAAPEGVYVYRIDITYPDGEVESRYGRVSLVR
jgi:gliding motility-associated-like protein